MAINTTVERIIFEGVDNISGAAKSAKGGTDSLRQSLDSVKSTLGALGVTVGAGAILNIYHDALKSIAALDDMAEATGASVEGLSAIQRVAKVGSHDFEGLTAQIGKMLKGLKEGSTEGGNSARALEYLGIKTRDANGEFRDTAQILIELAEKLDKYRDSGDKVVLINDALGKGAERYLPLLKDLADKTDRYATVTKQQAEAAEQAEKNMNRLKLSMEDTRKELVNELVPGLNKFLQVLLSIRDATPGAGAVRQGQLAAAIGMGNDPLGEIAKIEDRLATFKRQKDALNEGVTGKLNRLFSPEDNAILNHQIQFAQQELAAQKALLLRRVSGNAVGLAEDASGNVGPAPSKPSLGYVAGGDADAAHKEMVKRAELMGRLATQEHEREVRATEETQKREKAEGEIALKAYIEKLKREDEIVQRADEEQKRKDQAAQQEIARIQDIGRTDLEMEEVRYRKRRAVIEQSLLDDQTKYEAMEALESEHQKNMTEITDAETRKRTGIEKVHRELNLDSSRTFFGYMSGLMNTKNREMFEIGKTAAIAGAIIDTYKAATGAYASLASIPVVGPALGAAAAAAAVAAGMANVQAIRAQKFGQGGGATATFAASPTTGLPAGTPGGGDGGGGARQTTVIELRGGDIFTRDQIRDLVDRINENSRDGGNVVFAETRR